MVGKQEPVDIGEMMGQYHKELSGGLYSDVMKLISLAGGVLVIEGLDEQGQIDMGASTQGALAALLGGNVEGSLEVLKSANAAIARLNELSNENLTDEGDRYDAFLIWAKFNQSNLSLSIIPLSTSELTRLHMENAS